MTDGSRATVLNEYDDADQLVKTTDPTGAVTIYGYDGLGRRVASTQVVRRTGLPSLNLVASYAYDDVGNLTSVTSPGGQTTKFEYNNVGERTAVWQPGAATPTRTGPRMVP